MPTVFRDNLQAGLEVEAGEKMEDEPLTFAWTIKYLGWAALFVLLASAAALLGLLWLAWNYLPEVLRGFSLIARL